MNFDDTSRIDPRQKILQKREEAAQRRLAQKKQQQSVSLNVDLTNVQMPPHHKSYQFFVGHEFAPGDNGWVTNQSGHERIVKSMLDNKQLPLAKSVVYLSGSTPTNANIDVSVEVGDPVGGLPEMMAFCLSLDRAKAEKNQGTWVVLSLSEDDINSIVAPMLGSAQDSVLQQRFDQAVAAAYISSYSDVEEGKKNLRDMRPVSVVWDDHGRPSIIRLSDTTAIALCSTGIAGGGKDTANLVNRKVTGRRGTVAHLQEVATIVETARGLSNGVSSSICSHGSTSKDVVVQQNIGFKSDSIPFSGSWSWVLGSRLDTFPSTNRGDVALEIASSLALMCYAPQPSPRMGGSHIVFCDDSPGARRSMKLNQIEQQLIHHDVLEDQTLDRTDVRSKIDGWTYDLGRDKLATRLETADGNSYVQQSRATWVSSGAQITPDVLDRMVHSASNEHGLQGTMQDILTTSLSPFNSGMTAEFNPQKLPDMRKSVKSLWVKLHIPSSLADAYTKKHFESMKSGLAETARELFLHSETHVPPIFVVIYEVPDHLLDMPHLSIMGLTHVVDLLRLLTLDTEMELSELTPYHYTSMRASKSAKPKRKGLARARIDRMIDAIQSQEEVPVIGLWAATLQVIRERAFVGGWGGGQPRCDPDGFNL